MYQSLLDFRTTEKAIRLIKEFFQVNLSEALNITRVSAPLFVSSGSGINDDLNGVEAPIKFNLHTDLNIIPAEVVQSLAKWKRMKLADYGFNIGEGLYTDMNAIRPDEQLSNMHSFYVDQWDWERVIKSEEYNLEFLKSIVKNIYTVLIKTEFFMYDKFLIRSQLPENITFITAQSLFETYPTLTVYEREREATKKYGAIFIIGIGDALSNGSIHDGRAPDYDNWSLNGDLVVWNSVLERHFELSSMGIRVDANTLISQLGVRNCLERKELYWHKRLLNGELPLSIGGGIGQSRLCMYLLRKQHIGEVQSSIWPQEHIEACLMKNIHLL